MPKNPLSREAREEMSAVDMLAADKRDVDPKIWTMSHVAVIKAAANDPKVARIFVNAAIKKALCRDAGKDRGWLHKVRPWWGHNYHFHVRMVCQPGSPECEGQPPVGTDEGCTPKDFEYWLRDSVLNPPPPKPRDPNAPPPKPKPPLVMKDLPAGCKQVLLAP